MILVDTSAVLAAVDRSDPHHEGARGAFERAEPPFLLSPFVLAEIDYMVSTRVGDAAELALLEDVCRGAYRLEPFSSADVAKTMRIIERYRRLDVALADASIVVLSERHEVVDLLSLDRRHFGVIRASHGRKFRLRPS